jgi:hypothetical protein
MLLEGDLPNSEILSKYVFQPHQKIWVQWKDLKETEEDLSAKTTREERIERDDHKRDGWILETLLKVCTR